jgi:predicted nucleic-acid-binding protein
VAGIRGAVKEEMIAIDTKIIVRLIVNDDAAQVAVARRLMQREAILITSTVVLETEWVLRSVYNLQPQQILAGLTRIFGLENVDTENPAAIAKAFSAYSQGMDFADAMHLAQSARTAGFATFDKSLQRSAKRIGGFVPVMVP